MQFLDLIGRTQIQAEQCCLLFHCPSQRPFRDFLPYFAVDCLSAFNSYQATHTDEARITLDKYSYFASFVRLPDEWAVDGLPSLRASGKRNRWFIFTGVFEKSKSEPQPVEEVFLDPYRQTFVRAFGATGLDDERREAAAEGECQVYQISRTKILHKHIGKLVAQAYPSSTYARRIKNWKDEVFQVRDAYQIYLEWLGLPRDVRAAMTAALKRKDKRIRS